jgi:predicted aldo/keto reductase-like oxidoreductase
MEHRRLGRTGLDVSTIGLGTEYLNKKPRETVVATVREAIGRGVSYFDVVFSFPEYLDDLAVGFRGQRERLVLAGHLGSTVKDGQYCRTRSVKKSESFLLDVLARLGTDYVDVLFLHNSNGQKDYDTLMKPGGLLDLAQRLRQEGKARFIGFGVHTLDTARQAVESGVIDVLLFPVNLAGNATPGKKDLFKACAAHDVGLVAMKPYAGGKLLSKGRSVRIAGYHTSGEAVKLRKSKPITPVQCLAYVLAQVGVSTAIPGCADPAQLAAALACVSATEEEKDFAGLLAEFEQYVTGECVYCNHCLPCPAEIDIGQVSRLLDMAHQQMTAELRAVYAALPVKASDCTQCGGCEERCPFGVSVIARMERAAAVFG